MKTLLLIFCALAVSSAALRAKDEDKGYSDKIKFVMEQLRQEHDKDGVPLVEGINLGYGGRPGVFCGLYPYIVTFAKPEDVVKMIHDPNPVIRLMGAKRALYPWLFAFKPSVLDPLRTDKTNVRVSPLRPDDSDKIMTVAEVVVAMEKDPGFLMEWFEPESEQIAAKNSQTKPTK